MEVFHHFAKQEIEYKTIDVAELEEELEAFKNDKAKDVKACQKMKPKMTKLLNKMILLKMMTFLTPLRLSIFFSIFI